MILHFFLLVLSYIKLNTNVFYVVVNQISNFILHIFASFYIFVTLVHIYTVFRFLFYCESSINRKIYSKFKAVMYKNNEFETLVQISETLSKELKVTVIMENSNFQDVPYF